MDDSRPLLDLVENIPKLLFHMHPYMHDGILLAAVLLVLLCDLFLNGLITAASPGTDAHTAASVLLLYFASLPEPLLPRGMSKYCDHCSLQRTAALTLLNAVTKPAALATFWATLALFQDALQAHHGWCDVSCISQWLLLLCWHLEHAPPWHRQ